MPRKSLNPSHRVLQLCCRHERRAIKGNRQAATLDPPIPDTPLLERTAALFDLELMARHDLPAGRRDFGAVQGSLAATIPLNQHQQ